MYLGQTGEAAWGVIKKNKPVLLTIEADRNLAALKFISLMNKLESMNITQLEMIVNDPINEPQR
jgi:biopolymer transport protein ExbD